MKFYQYIHPLILSLTNRYRRVLVNDSHFYLRNLIIVFWIDSLLTDDEPIWEPIEWSLVQTWLFFIFLFAWMGEVMISTRFGNYVGRDKRVWLAWYKSFWNIEIWYLISFGLAIIFVVIPFYYEITYRLPFVVSWWDWFSREFFFKFATAWFLISVLSSIIIMKIEWMAWKEFILLITLIELFILYLFYWQMLNTMIGFLTDPIWYQKIRLNDFVQLSHEPIKWGWGSSKRDHFTYHRVSTNFWFKNDGPFAEAILLMNFFLSLSLFFVNFFWLILIRRVYSIREIPVSFFVYASSILRQILFIFVTIIILIFFSLIISYWRFPIEFLWVMSVSSWFVALGAYLSNFLFS